MMSFKNKILLLTVLTVGFCMRSMGQDGVESRIKQIEVESKKIDGEIKKLKMTQEDINDRSEEGGILKKYYEGQTLRKAMLTLFGETGQSITEYYFSNGTLIFVNDFVKTYTGPVNVSKGETQSTETNKFYLNNEKKLIRWQDNDGVIVDDSQYLEKEQEFSDDLKYIINKQ